MKTLKQIKPNEHAPGERRDHRATAGPTPPRLENPADPPKATEVRFWKSPRRPTSLALALRDSGAFGAVSIPRVNINVVFSMPAAYQHTRAEAAATE
jgi:hypothetical protein